MEKTFPAPEKSARFFHTMEKVFAIFPHNGKNVSTVWKTFEPRRNASRARAESNISLVFPTSF
jgi:hypothetical protein